MAGQSAPLFVLSLRARGELAAAVQAGGWRPVAARSPEDADRRFAGSGARIALVDGRGAFDEALGAVRLLAPLAEANGAALVAILTRRELPRLDLLFDAGATHYLVSPFEPEELAAALLFAERHAQRCGLEPAEVSPAPDEAIGAAARGRAVARDPLTGVGDARTARRWLASQLARPDETPRCAVAMLAIDRFDMINAAYGRAVGDVVLEAVARRVERVLDGLEGRRKLLARLSGPEFLVGIGGPRSRDETMFVADRIRDALDRAFIAGDRVIELSCRIGLAVDEGEEDAGVLLRRAGAALADARGGPAGAVRVTGAADDADRERAGRLEVDIRHALAADEIEILFQPQVAVATGAIVGAEALARWRHPTLGQIGAEALLAAAERSDFVDALSRHIHREALACVAEWPDVLSGVRASINVTAADLARPDFAEAFAARVAEAGLSPGRITLEIVESDLIGDLGGAAELLASLRALGFRVAIDDFGTGYSSLAYLKALPLDYLKIDRRLSQDIAGSPRDRVVVRGVIEMARSLGLSVIAEGVETPEQLALLAAEGCNLYQGFLCSPPVPSEALAGLMDDERRIGSG